MFQAKQQITEETGCLLSSGMDRANLWRKKEQWDEKRTIGKYSPDHFARPRPNAKLSTAFRQQSLQNTAIPTRAPMV
ncbi:MULTISPECIES: hypothetical protein [Rhizobium]|jgi:hypothetical protein|uniref:Uncharacterized protein n=1 Tax=Rhizobium miluonense TaxID=411945 RepID=A0ABU1SMC0_9HYPH|nr:MULTISPECIES: hypothetical protein [Rhizobium]MBB3427709.1 hypothetical protein [Rhizobium sp. BK312]MDR6899993.1 hypothetical protein [Rhizobium miluonense]